MLQSSLAQSKNDRDVLQRSLAQGETNRDMLRSSLAQGETNRDMLQSSLAQGETNIDMLQRSLAQGETNIDMLQDIRSSMAGKNSCIKLNHYREPHYFGIHTESQYAFLHGYSYICSKIIFQF